MLKLKIKIKKALMCLNFTFIMHPFPKCLCPEAKAHEKSLHQKGQKLIKNKTIKLYCQLFDLRH